MNKKGRADGVAGIEIILAISIATVFITACTVFNLSGRDDSRQMNASDGLGYQAVSVKPNPSNPFWGGDSGDSRFVEYRNKLDLSLPNIGLKDPKDITWRYTESAVYELHHVDIANSNGPSKSVKLTCEYEIDEDGGGELMEEYRYDNYGSVTTINNTCKYDPAMMTQFVKLNFVTNLSGMSGISSGSINMAQTMTYKDGKLHTKLDLPPMMLYQPDGGSETMNFGGGEYDAPKAGFFYITGPDSPGFIALLFSALDLDGKKDPEVWVLGPSPLGWGGGVMSNFLGLEPLFSRLTVTPMDRFTADQKKTWDGSRKEFNNYQPPEDVRIFILETDMEFDISVSPGLEYIIQNDLKEPSDENPLPFAYVYVDDEGRVVRIEQAENTASPVAELKTVGGGGPWWGHAKQPVAEEQTD